MLAWRGVGDGERAITAFPLGALLFALAASTLLVSAAKPHNPPAWFMSFVGFTLATLWRLVALIIVRTRDGDIYGRDDLIFAAIGIYGALIITSVATWMFFRPGGSDVA